MLRSLLSSLLTLTCIASASYAEEQSDRPGVAFIEYIASINMCLIEVNEGGTCPEGRLRKLGVHRVTTGGSGARNFYVHEPALLPIRSKVSNDGWPNIIHSVKASTIAGTAKEYLHIKLLSSSRLLQENAANAVRAAPSEVARIQGTSSTEPGMSLQDVYVLPWEMTRARMEILSVPGNIVLARSDETFGHAGNAEVWEFYVPISEDPTDLRAALESGRYSIRVSYSYLGSQPAKQVNLRAASSTKLKEEFENVLASFQLEENSPILQQEQQAIKHDLQRAVALSIDANDVKLVEMMMQRQFSVLMKDLFVDQADPMAIEDLIKARSLKAVEDYLTPVYRELENTSRKYADTTITEEQKRTVDFGAGINIKAVKVGFDVKRQDIEKIQEKYGVEFKANQKTKIMVPHAIAISYLAQNQISKLNRLAFSIQVENAKIGSYSRSEIIPASMSVNASFLGGVVPNLTYGVPVGTALCSFVASKNAPTGYRWIKEGNKWPKMALFGRLAGQPMPNMNDMLIGATESLEIAGNSWTAGQVIVEQTTIPGSSFTINGPEMLGRTTTQLDLRKNNSPPIFGGFEQWNMRFMHKNPPQRSRINTGHGLKFIPTTIVGQYSPNPDDTWRGSFIPLEAKFFKAPESVQGAFTVPQKTVPLNVPTAMPNHLKCRWMIKVH